LSMGAPQGVDLNLDKFNLSVPMEGGIWAGDLQASSASLAIGAAFWSELETGSLLKDEDRRLLLDVFHPHLSDRRGDGDEFVPPPTNGPHMAKLKQLVKAERVTRQRRRQHFFSEAFHMDKADPLFPSTWAATVELADGPAEHLTPRPEYLAEQGLLAEFVKTLAPVFDRCTEDAARFRMYRFGALEVRSVQEFGGEEEIGAVFSISPEGAAEARACAAQDDDIVEKVSEYIEHSADAPCCRPYVVMETRRGDIIVTERSGSGPATWAENPAGMDRRNALARLLRQRSAMACPMTVKELRGLMAQQSLQKGSPFHYSKFMFCKGAGQRYCEATSGFLRAGSTLPQREFAMFRMPFSLSRFGVL